MTLIENLSNETSDKEEKGIASVKVLEVGSTYSQSIGAVSFLASGNNDVALVYFSTGGMEVNSMVYAILNYAKNKDISVTAHLERVDDYYACSELEVEVMKGLKKIIIDNTHNNHRRGELGVIEEMIRPEPMR